VTTEFSLMLPELTEQDRYLVAGPIGHSGGVGCLSFMAAGAAQVVMPAFSVEGALAVIPRERITMTLLVPTMINMIVNHPDSSAADLSSLRAVIYAAAPISERTLNEALRLWGDIMIQSYGQSEGLPSTVLRPRDYADGDTVHRRQRLRSAGRPTPNTVIRILGEDGDELALGEVGEIVVGSPCVMAGLWEDPDRTAERMTERGEVRTRDMGYLDQDGFLFLADRKEDLIISGGFNVWPAEIEDALMMHDAVLEAAVVGVPDPKWGETPKAVVVLRDGHSAGEDELIAYCRDRLGGVKKPTEVVFRDRPLEKTAAGKIQRRALREEYWPLEDPAWIAGA
jgi:acyl-CoA synthetase (AMP-forming)/AMP-acid ligase II